MNYTREQAEDAKQIVKDFMQHHDICINSYKWSDFLNAKFPAINPNPRQNRKVRA